MRVLCSWPDSILAAELADTGASTLAFTSNDPAIKQALNLLDAGNFSKAQKLISTTQPSADPAVTQARAEMLDVIERTRREYSLEEPDLLAQIRQRLPDASERDITHWREACDLKYRIIDDKRFYLRREAQNLFIFSADAKKRLTEKESPSSGWKLADHRRRS